MIACVYIKDGNIHFFNERGSLSGIGGISYELGRPLLDLVCYEQDRFDDAFSVIASAFDNDFAHIGAKEPDFISELQQIIGEIQQREVYVFFYSRMLMDFIYTFIDSPQKAIVALEEILPGAEEKLRWAISFEWPTPPRGKVFADTERRLFRAVMDVVALMSEHLCKLQKFIIHEIDVLLHYRGEIEVPIGRSIDYIDILDEYHMITVSRYFYLERAFRTFYGRTTTKEVEQFYEISSVEDLFRFEFTRMIEHDLFIKRCKNCGHFFIPRGRADTEYCGRIFGDNEKKCNEIGAMLRYDRKVAENPILEAHKKAYRRFHSRTRTKKMTQNEFLKWSEEASRKRDECLGGMLSFEEFVAWLEQDRVRKARTKHEKGESLDDVF